MNSPISSSDRERRSGRRPESEVSLAEHILKSTVGLLREKSVEDISISDLASRADVSVSTIYYYFKNKQSLFAEAQRQIYFDSLAPLHQQLAKVHEVLADEDEEAFWTHLSQVVSLSCAMGRPHERFAVVKQFQLIADAQDHEEDLATAIGDQLDVWTELCKRAQSRSWVRRDIEPASVVFLFWAATLGQVILPLAVTSHTTTEALASAMIDLLRPVATA